MAYMEYEKLAGMIGEVLNLDPDLIKMESALMQDLGADSLDVFQIMILAEEELQREIDPAEAEKVVTVGELFGLLQKMS